MSAPHFKLDNLVAILDNNKFQQTGACSEILDTGSLKDKWKSFGWETVEVDGHDIKSLLEVFSEKNEKDKPKMIVAKTIKGKGFSFSENSNDWHHKILTKSQYDIALNELKNNQ